MTRFLLIVAVVAGLAGVLLAPEAHAGPRPRPVPFNPGVQPRPQPVSHFSNSLNVTYASLQGGCKVIALGNGGSNAFADGTTLDVGDVVVKVGGRFCGIGTDVDALIALAYQNGNTEIQVRDVNTGQVFSFTLP